MNTMKSLSIICIFLISLLFHSNSTAQNYPIQTNIQLTPPYSSYLPDYTDAGNSKLQVNLQITDVNVSVLQVRLKLTLEGPGGMIMTNPNYHPIPTTVNYGTPALIAGTDLAPYLAVENLVFPTSAFRESYLQTKTLPEGLWKLCIEVYDATKANAEVLSTNNCNLMFVSQNQPPILNLPTCASTISNGQNILFSWTDMAMGTQTIGNEPVYIFSLYALPESAYSNPTQALSTNPIYTTNTNVTSLNLNTNDVLLVPGQHYLWRVKATLPNGASSYLNNGFSAPCDFIFSDGSSDIINDLTINLTAIPLGPITGKASWTLTSASNSTNVFDSYRIAYRKAGNPYYSWYENTVEANDFSITLLEESTQYEVKIKGIVGTSEGEWTSVVTFTTNAYPVYACGEGNRPVLPIEYAPLAPYNAYPGIIVAQSQFKMEVTNIEALAPTPGHYKGTGKVYIDFIHASVRVDFTDLLIDAEFNAREGDINVISQGLDAWLSEQYLNESTPIFIDSTITSGGFLNDTTAYVIADGDTVTFPVTDPFPTIIHDNDNNEYQFWPDGHMVVAAYGLIVSQDNLDVKNDEFIYFVESDTESYPTDKKEYGQFSDNYELILGVNQFKYFVANKSVSMTEGDVAKAYVHANLATFIPEEVVFKISGNSTPIPYTLDPNDTTYILTLPIRGYDYAVYAEYGELRLGKLNVKAFEEKTKNVTIVPLVDMVLTKTAIETELNKLYKGAHLTMNVTIAEKYSDATFTSTTVFENPNTTLLSKYTAQMRSLRDAYLLAHPMDNDQYLMFVVPSFAESTIDGYMVRGRGVGFVTASTLINIQTFTHTLGHELGHGMGGLQHAWGEEASLKGESNNLMDYSTGTKLICNQWKELSNPSIIITFLDDEEDAESASWSVYENSGDIQPSQILETINFYNFNRVVKIHFNVPVSVKGNVITHDNKEYTLTVNLKSNEFSGFYLSSELVSHLKSTTDGINTYTGTSTVTKFSNFSLILDEELMSHTIETVKLLKKRADIDKERLDKLEELINKVTSEGFTAILNNTSLVDINSPCGLETVDVTDLSKVYTPACWDAIISQFQAIINASTTRTNSLLTLINKTTITSADKISIVTKFQALTEIDYGTFSADERLLILSYFSTQDLWGTYNQTLSEETYCLKLLKNADKNQFAVIIRGLEKTPVVLNDVTLKPKETGSLFKNLATNINDAIWGLGIGGDNNKELMGILVSMLANCEEVKNEKLAKCYNNEKVILVRNSYLFPDDNEKILDAYYSQVGNEEIIIKQSHWEQHDNCYADEMFGECVTTYEKVMDSYEKYSPFDLIVISDKSDFSLIEGVGASNIDNNVTVLPAFVTIYAKASGDEENIFDYLLNTANVLTFAVPFTKIADAPIWANRLFRAIDLTIKANSAANLAVNNTGLANVPEIAEVLDCYNKITLALAVIDITKGLSNYRATKLIRSVEKPATLNGLLQAEHAGNTYAKSILRIKNILNNYGFKKTGNKNWWKVVDIAVDAGTRLDNILAHSNFSGPAGIFNKFLKNTEARISRYYNLETFRDEFLRLHSLCGDGVKSIDDVLSDFENLIVNYTNANNVNKVTLYVDELMQQVSKFKGGAYGLEIINGLPPSLVGKTLLGFEETIDDFTNCRYDLKFDFGNGKFLYVETKNYAIGTTFSSSFYNQFKAYVSSAEVSNINQIKYLFRSNTGIGKAERVQKFKNMLNIGNRKQELFNSMSPSLKSQLNIDELSDLNDVMINNILNSIIEVF